MPVKVRCVRVKGELTKKVNQCTELSGIIVSTLSGLQRRGNTQPLKTAEFEELTRKNGIYGDLVRWAKIRPG